ncbi:MAG: IS200/IS605 family transposase, partial [Pyrinomonadaceae bacterium]
MPIVKTGRRVATHETMANTYSSLFLHIVFSTKNRKRWITPEIEHRVWAYIGGIARIHGLTAIQVGGTEDHIHALILARPIHSPSAIAKWLKADSSKWIHQEFENMRSFAWQDGFGAFSVSKSNVPAVVDYIMDQRKHHEEESFETEYERLMKLHEVDYDPKYLFD